MKVFRPVRNYLHGWSETLRIMIFDRELYHRLREPIDLDDFGEVSEPGDGE
jgi:hypothetical protein